MHTEKPQTGRRVLWFHIRGYTVCLCPIKRTPGKGPEKIVACCLFIFVYIKATTGAEGEVWYL